MPGSSWMTTTPGPLPARNTSCVVSPYVNGARAKSASASAVPTTGRRLPMKSCPKPAGTRGRRRGCLTIAARRLVDVVDLVEVEVQRAHQRAPTEKCGFVRDEAVEDDTDREIAFRVGERER